MIEYVIAASALLCVGIKYINVSAMNGPLLGQLLRLSPILGYLGLAVGVLYAPALLLPSLLGTLVLRFLDELAVVRDIYNQARKAIPPNTAELLRRLRYAPWVLIGLVLIYIITVKQHQVPPTTKATSADTVQSAPTPVEKTEKQKLDSLNSIEL